MTKLVYPKDGLVVSCGKSVRTCTRKLSGAIGECSFDIPSDFVYSNYLNGLESKLNAYLATVHEISSKIKKTDREFSNLSDSLEDSAKKITVNKLRNRERMIV